MPTCTICLDTLKGPAALPCGHVFCYECILRVVRDTQPFTQEHSCPSCRIPYTISNIDAALVPSHLRPHVTPSIRRLRLEYSIPTTLQSSSPISECERLRAENASLKMSCQVWRQRAGVHAVATLGLVGLTRVAKDFGLKMKAERDAYKDQYECMKRKYEGSQSWSPSTICPPLSESRSGSPCSRSPSPCPSEDLHYPDCPDCRLHSKRKREADDILPPLKRSRSAAAHSALSQYFRGNDPLQA